MKREEIFQKYENKPENILLILHDIQDENPNKYLTEEDLREVSERLDLPYSFVYGVASFYSMFSLKPRGKYIIRVCESPPCHLMGSENILDELKKILEVDIGETTKDNLFTLEISSCLGVCGVAPAIMINEDVYGNLTKEKIKEIIDNLRREK
ncbi:MAG: NADH-quinone oxidoreductase subunit NuoE [Caldisericia bacterium]|nr:NADH-quinone oxidoreductase subunit NuoE [Caldisericia bacterium]